jgi:glucose 1-dehydrogenase
MLKGLEGKRVLITGAAAAYITGQTIYVDGGLTLSADYRQNWAS